MNKIQPIREVKHSVTCFLQYGEMFLFLLRNGQRSVDANKLNGIGGKVESNENFLAAAIRETKEETGFEVTEQDIELVAVGQIRGGYPEDWTMCFFKIAVPSLTVPIGMNIPEGELIWLHKDSVLSSEYELVDDLHYCWNEIATGSSIVFFNANVNSLEKIDTISLHSLKK